MALFTKKNQSAGSNTTTVASHTVARAVVMRPHMTEKSFRNASHRQYTFVIDARVSKQEAIKEIEKMYRVHVIDTTVTTITKKKPSFRGLSGHTQRTKKVTVTLAAGEHIDITGNS